MYVRILVILKLFVSHHLPFKTSAQFSYIQLRLILPLYRAFSSSIEIIQLIWRVLCLTLLIKGVDYWVHKDIQILVPSQVI